MSNTSQDRNAFRRALGNFATGVTVITTVDDTGKNYGLTANSFNSVSLDPPLILWSLDKKSSGRHAFGVGRAFAVHILSEDQVDFSNTFAVTSEDKFVGIEYDRSADQVPVLPGCAAVFRCETQQMYEAGDHIIVVGKVRDFDVNDASPLVFYKGAYCKVEPRLA